MSVCPACGSEFTYLGRGRPRTYCVDCTPPGCSGSERLNATLEANRERLEQDRREAHEAWMARWRESLRQRKEQVEANRRKTSARGVTFRRGEREGQRRRRNLYRPSPRPGRYCGDRNTWSCLG